MKLGTRYAFLVVFLLTASMACKKNSPTGPEPAPPAVPTSTPIPCGYPGDTCTMTATFTATSTRTPSSTPTNTLTPLPTHTATSTRTATSTSTPSPTFTSTPLPTPISVVGIVNTASNANLVWVKDTDPNITQYKVYMSPDGVTYNLYGTFSKSLFPATVCGMIDNPAGTTFNRYYYVVSSNGGVSPDSPPSRIVHALSGTVATNTLNLNITLGSPVNLSISGGSVSGGVKRLWMVEDLSLNSLWLWGEEAASLTTVGYGYSNTNGKTYVPASALSSGVTYIMVTYTLNNENWEKDISSQGFLIP